MGIVTTSLFILLYLFLITKSHGYKEVILSIVIISVFYINSYGYFNLLIPNENMKCRILEDRQTYSYAGYNGKIIKVKGTGNIEVGRNYLFKGDFNKVPDISRGVIGIFDVKEEVPLKADLIYKGYKIKDNIYKKIVKTLGKDNSGVLMAICYGDTRYMEYDKMEYFNHLGISHVISVSGFHVALIYSAITVVLGYKISILILFIYVVFTGAEAATVRAFIMIVLIIIGKRINKNYDKFSALYFSAFILIMLKPYNVVDSGCLLSFLGMGGIFVLYDKFKRWLYKLPNFINESISMTLSASIFTVPYIIMKFKTFSLGGIISNLLLMPFYTFIVIIGNLMLLFSKISIIYDILSNMCSAIFFIINNMEGALVKIIPTPMAFTYLDGIIIMFLYLSYLLIKRGYSSLKYIPIVFSLLVIFQGYNYFPKLNFINGGTYDIIEVRYKNQNILVASKKVKLKSIYEKLNLYRIYDEFENNIIISLNEDLSLNFIKEKDDLLLKVTSSEQTTYLHIKEIYDNNENSQCCIRYTDYDKSYDIIEVIKNKDLHKKGRYYESYNVINGNLWHNYIH